VPEMGAGGIGREGKLDIPGVGDACGGVCVIVHLVIA
jgi:hypothetical protein